jgi:Ca2+-binding RTX toxin-like protein
MANYIFESITSAQAASYSAANDTLTFSNTNLTATRVTVTPSYVPGSATTAGGTLAGVVLTDTLTGRSVNFGAGIGAESTFTFSDGSTLFVGDVGNDTFAVTNLAAPAQLDGFQGNDTLTGGNASDLIQGNQGDDSLIGGLGNDTLYGGQANDVIVATSGNRDLVNGNRGDDTITGPSNANLASAFSRQRTHYPS